MKNFKLLILSFISLFLVACDVKVHDTEVSRLVKKYELVGINPPKHFYVDLKDIETGRIYKGIYISKHCNAWRNLKMGTQFTLYEVIYQRDNEQKERYVRIEGARSHICDYARSLN